MVILLKIIFRLYEHRVNAGLSTMRLAELSGVSKSQINYIENGQSNPTVLVICMLAEALGKEPSELFYIDRGE